MPRRRARWERTGRKPRWMRKREERANRWWREVIGRVDTDPSVLAYLGEMFGVGGKQRDGEQPTADAERT
jgi:hypothetical protein